MDHEPDCSHISAAGAPCVACASAKIQRNIEKVTIDSRIMLKQWHLK